MTLERLGNSRREIRQEKEPIKDTADYVEMLIKNPWGGVELLLPF